jgi:hypothetical protein
VSGRKTAGFHLAVKRRPREWDQGEHLLYALHWPNLSSSRVLFTFVFVDHSPSCPGARAQVTLRPDEVHALAFRQSRKCPCCSSGASCSGEAEVERRHRTIGCHGEQKGKQLPAVFDCRVFRLGLPQPMVQAHPTDRIAKAHRRDECQKKVEQHA